jgi:ParB family chromosome partitioning protein
MRNITKVSSETSSVQGVIEELSISELRMSPIAIRRSMEGMEELARSIKEKGLLQPLVVRPVDEFFEIVAGCRRFAACKQLKWRKVLCHIAELDDKSAYEISLIENVQRKSMNPVEEAQAYKNYVEKYGWGSIASLADRIAKSSSYVSKRISLLDLPYDVIDRIQNREIRPSVAEELLRIQDQTKQSNLARMIAMRHLSLRMTRDLVNEHDAFQIDATGETELEFEQYEKAYNKMILCLKLALRKTAPVVEEVQDNWPIYNMLLYHRSLLNSQIDLILREKKKIVNLHHFG